MSNSCYQQILGTKRLGAEEAHRAHNPRVPGSKPGVATSLFFSFRFYFVAISSLPLNSPSPILLSSNQGSLRVTVEKQLILNCLLFFIFIFYFLFVIFLFFICYFLFFIFYFLFLFFFFLFFFLFLFFIFHF